MVRPTASHFPPCRLADARPCALGSYALSAGQAVRYWQCRFVFSAPTQFCHLFALTTSLRARSRLSSGTYTGPNTWGGLVSCGGQQYWVADAGNACGSLAVTGSGWSVVTACAANAAGAHNASGMCLSCWTDQSVAGLTAYCASQGVKGSAALSCCVSVVQERLQGKTQLVDSCSACQQQGLCPESNSKWTDITKDTNLALCRHTSGARHPRVWASPLLSSDPIRRISGKVDNDNSGTPVTWCHNDGFGIVAIIIVGCFVVFSGIVWVIYYFAPCCPPAKRRLQRVAGLLGQPQFQQQQQMAQWQPPPQVAYGFPVPQQMQPGVPVQQAYATPPQMPGAHAGVVMQPVYVPQQPQPQYGKA